MSSSSRNVGTTRPAYPTRAFPWTGSWTKRLKEAREGGKSEEAVQADIWELVRESYQRMLEQYGISESAFNPNLSMACGRLTRLLHNLENNPEIAAFSIFAGVSD